MKSQIKTYKTLAVILLSLIGFSAHSVQAQRIPNKPQEILKLWDYYTLTEKLGEGSPIIDTLAGKAYISGMQYQETWFGTPATASYYFTDIDVSSLKLRFWSPNMEKRTGGKVSNVTDPAQRDSLLRVFQIKDSLRMDSVNRILRLNPSLIKTMQEDSEKLNEQSKILYDLDSIRCDSLIHNISAVFGPTLRQDTTTHTETARYIAIWIEDGIATSLKDFTDYTDLVFSSPTIKYQDALKFGISDSYEIFEKQLITRENQTVEITLCVLPVNQSITDYTGICLMAHQQNGEVSIQKVHQEAQLQNPSIRFEDFDNNDQEEIWIKYEVSTDTTRRVNKIYSYEDGELLTIFDSNDEIIDGIVPRLLHGFQAEISFADGTVFMFPIEKNTSAIQGLYNSTGVLTGDDIISPYRIKYLKSSVNPSDSTRILEGRVSLKIGATGGILGDILVRWKYNEGYWDIIDYQITE